MRFDMVGVVEDVTVKTTGSGKEFSILRVKEPHSFKDGVMCVADICVFGHTRDALEGLHAGTPVVINGTIDSELTDKGYIRPSFKADRIATLDVLLGGRPAQARQPFQQAQQARPHAGAAQPRPAPQQASPAPAAPEGDGDMPF